jgi:hypothetical protein
MTGPWVLLRGEEVGDVFPSTACASWLSDSCDADESGES